MGDILAFQTRCALFYFAQGGVAALLFWVLICLIGGRFEVTVCDLKQLAIALMSHFATSNFDRSKSERLKKKR